MAVADQPPVALTSQHESAVARWAARISFWLLWTLAILLLATSLLAYWPSLDWRLRLVIPFRPQYLYLAFLLASLGSLVRAGKGFLACCLLSAVTNLWVLWPYYLPAWESSARPALHLMAWNTWSGHADPNHVLQRIRNSGQDLVVLCETPYDWRLEPAPKIAGYHTLMTEEFLFALRQDAPLKLRSHSFARKPFGYQVVILWEDRPLRLLITHQTRPTQEVLQSIQRYRLDQMQKWLEESDLPTVILGDFNQTPWCPPLQTLLQASRLRDSAVGRGISPTFPGDLPGVRWIFGVPIDHCLLTPEIACVKRSVLPSEGSNHCPVSVQLAWQEEG